MNTAFAPVCRRELNSGPEAGSGARSPVLADAFLADAVRSGVLAAPALSGSGPPPKPPPAAALDEVLAELDESRGDR